MNRIHRQVTELLPWYVNGTLPERGRSDVERHLSECLTCRARLRDENRVARLVSGQDELPLAPAHGLTDLLARIDRKASSSAAGRWPPRLALVGALATVLTLSLVWLNRPWLQPAVPDSGSFSTLSDEAVAPAGRLDLVFAEGVERAVIDGILRAINGTIVAGPTELGRYTVSMAEADEARLQAVIEQLRADPRVRFAGRNYIGTPEPAEPTE